MQKCDFKIIGAAVYDGTGADFSKSDVVVCGDHIEHVGNCSHWQAEQVVDAQGLCLCPGFIDVHTHDDAALLDNPAHVCKVSQGVTTVITGNCGISLAPVSVAGELPAPFPLLAPADRFCFPTVSDYRNAIERRPPSVNVAMLAGHSSLRLDSMRDRLDRAASGAEIDAMKAALRLALQQGCIGFSTGLDYPPAASAPASEIVALASVLPEFGPAVYATHMRDEGDHVLEAIGETLETGRRANVPIVISHHKCAGPANYGKSVQTLKLIDAVRSEGQRVAMDIYPYTASSTSLLPEFVRDAEAVLVAESTPFPECNGKLLDDIAREWQCTTVEAAEKLYPASAVYFQMADDDVERILAHPAAMIGSDGIPGMRNPHPRLWGTFPRVLGHYVRKKMVLDLTTAIHKMTGLSAETFGLDRRGRISPGFYADLVLFDPGRVIDNGTFEEPEQLSDGIDKVWINGAIGWENKAGAAARHGRFLVH